MRKWYCINNFTFYPNEEIGMVKIQVGDNCGNQITCRTEEARKVYRAVRDGVIVHPNSGKDTFQTIREVRRFLLGVVDFKEA